MQTDELYEIADENGIRIDVFPMPATKSAAVMSDGKCFVALDPNIITSNAAGKVCLAHEIGHCETASFYNLYSPLDLRGKHEKKADRWAIEHLIPPDELEKLIRQGCADIQTMADNFGVTVEFMEKALKFYYCK